MWGCPLPPCLIAIRPHFSNKILDNLRYSILDRFLWILTSILEVFLDPKSMFSKSSCCLILNFNLRSEVQKSWFYLWHSCFEVATNEKHKKTGKKSLRNQVVFSHWFFLDFGANLDGFWPPSWSPKNGFPLPFFQVAAKRRPRGAQEAPRASQGRLKSLQQPPKRAPRVPKSDQNVPRARPRCLPRVTFLRIFLFSHVFLCFFAFSCVFLCFSLFFLCFFTANPR